MWCFQGLEAMGRTGSGADDSTGAVLCVVAGAGPIDCHAALSKCLPGCACVPQVQDATGFLARLSRQRVGRQGKGEGEVGAGFPAQLAGGRAH